MEAANRLLSSCTYPNNEMNVNENTTPLLDERAVRILSHVMLALQSSNGCAATDRPDLIDKIDVGFCIIDNSCLIDHLHQLIVNYGAHTQTGSEYARGVSIQVRGIDSDSQYDASNTPL